MKKLTALLLVLCLLCPVFASCSKDSMNESYDYESKVESGTSGSYDEVAKDDAATDDPRKIIKTYHLSLETKNFEEDSRFIVSEAEALGADAIVNIRYASSAVMQSAAEVIAYGTAVRFVNK